MKIKINMSLLDSDRACKIQAWALAIILGFIINFVISCAGIGLITYIRYLTGGIILVAKGDYVVTTWDYISVLGIYTTLLGSVSSIIITTVELAMGKDEINTSIREILDERDNEVKEN